MTNLVVVLLMLGGVEKSFDKYGSDVLFAAISSAVLTHLKHFLKLKLG